jgi:hypothetical protein
VIRHRRLIRRRTLIALGAFLLAIRPALSEAGDSAASPGPSGRDSPGETAATLQRQGVDLFHAKQYEAARVALARAFELDPRAETLLELGMAELFTDRPVEAATHLKEYVGRKDAPRDKLQIVQKTWLRQAELQTAHLDIYVPSGAEIAIDGTLQDRPPSARSPVGPAGRAPMTIIIRAGEHDVMERYGTAEEVKHVMANGGERVEIHFEPLLPEPPAAAPPPKPLPSEAPEPNASRLARNSSTSKWATVVGLGASAVVLAGVAGGFSVAFNQVSGEAGRLSQTQGPSGCAQATSASCGQLRQDHDAEHTDATLATGFYVGAAVAALGAAASWALWPSSSAGSKSSGAMRLTPAIAARQVGLAMSGAW